MSNGKKNKLANDRGAKKNQAHKSWLNNHLSDSYVKQAAIAGYRSRSAYKLRQLNEQDALFKGVHSALDLGSAPGGWLQVLKEYLAKDALILGVDLLNMLPIKGVHFIQGDFTLAATITLLEAQLNNTKLDLITCDMAPNLSGIKSVDQSRMLQLILAVIEFACVRLKSGGNCIIKIFQGDEFASIVMQCRALFKQVLLRKPLASRSSSSETYLVCKHLL